MQADFRKGLTRMSKRQQKTKPPAAPPPAVLRTRVRNSPAADWRQEAERAGREAFEAATAPDPEPTPPPWWESQKRKEYNPDEKEDATENRKTAGRRRAGTSTRNPDVGK
jgi:hypothetical protein